jgi:hypothetical protein
METSTIAQRSGQGRSGSGRMQDLDPSATLGKEENDLRFLQRVYYRTITLLNVKASPVRLD